MDSKLTVEQIILSREFADFYQLANIYCEQIEKFNSNSKYDFLLTTRQILLNLYDKALNLQWVDLQSDADFDEKLDDNYYYKLISFIADRLHETRYYWNIYNPTIQEDKEVVCFDLVDDLGDIYKELKYSIMIYNLNKTDCKEIALWQFKFGFDKHWGNHCINALRAIHFFLQDE